VPRSFVIVAALLVGLWLASVAFVFIVRPDRTALSDAARLLPDTVRLVKRLAGDHTIPRHTRWLVWMLLVYLASPIDLIPDFVPVVGVTDDAIISYVVLRHVVRRAGPKKLLEHWPGSPDGLAALERVLRLPESH
jgi:uncharacterized membrane protein YkvA (DUF1232 family)